MLIAGLPKSNVSPSGVTVVNPTGGCAFFANADETGQDPLEVRQYATSGASAAASITSMNPDTSTLLINGVEKSKGTIKIAHVGYKDGSDASASAISIDLQTAGTASQGIFLTATTGPTKGAPLVIRNNNRDDFVVKGNGRVGIGVASGVQPAAQMEIKQTDPTTEIGLLLNGGSVLLVTANAHGSLSLDTDGNLIFTAESGKVTKIAGN